MNKSGGGENAYPHAISILVKSKKDNGYAFLLLAVSSSGCSLGYEQKPHFWTEAFICWCGTLVLSFPCLNHGSTYREEP